MSLTLLNLSPQPGEIDLSDADDHALRRGNQLAVLAHHRALGRAGKDHTPQVTPRRHPRCIDLALGISPRDCHFRTFRAGDRAEASA